MYISRAVIFATVVCIAVILVHRTSRRTILIFNVLVRSSITERFRMAIHFSLRLPDGFIKVKR